MTDALAAAWRIMAFFQHSVPCFNSGMLSCVRLLFAYLESDEEVKLTQDSFMEPLSLDQVLLRTIEYANDEFPQLELCGVHVLPT